MNNLLKQKSSSFSQLMLLLILCFLGVLFGQLLMYWHAPMESVVLVYLLCVVLVSATTNGYAYGIAASVICIFAYNFFVTEPTFSIVAFGPENLLTFSLMCFLSIVICFIASRMKKGETDAKRKEEENLALYHLTRDLGRAQTVLQAYEIAMENISTVFQTNCKILTFNNEGKPSQTCMAYENGAFQKEVPTDSTRDFSEYQTKPLSGYYLTERQQEWPIYGSMSNVIASLAIPRCSTSKMTLSDIRLISTMAEAVGIVVDRINFADLQESSRQEVSQERFRSNLLRSVSHDLRTPLAGICGTAEVLMSMVDEEKDQQIYDLARDIRKETSWLYDLVQNILSLTKLQNENFKINKQPEIVEDVINAAVENVHIRFPGRTFKKELPDEIILAPMDSSLIRQVLINLMDNANKYTPDGGEITIKLEDQPQEDCVEISVLDTGCGITPEAMNKIFEMFYTTKAKRADSMRGIGLGLPICDSIMKAHGGSIHAANRTDCTGSVFSIRLPKEGYANVSVE